METRDETETPTDATKADDVHAAASDVDTVDALEQRLAQLENAMDQIQGGDLDGAESTISALEQQMGSVRD